MNQDWIGIDGEDMNQTQLLNIILEALALVAARQEGAADKIRALKVRNVCDVCGHELDKNGWCEWFHNRLRTG